MTVNIIRENNSVREAEGELREKILNLTGEVPSGYGVVVKETKGGALFKNGEHCSLCVRESNGGLVINLRCVGAYAGNNTHRVFVVWRDSRSREPIVAEYTGKDLFDESKSYQ